MMENKATEAGDRHVSDISYSYKTDGIMLTEWAVIQHSDNVFASGSGLKGGIVPSSSDVSGSAVRQEQDGGSRQKTKDRTSEVERQVRLSTAVSGERDAVWKKETCNEPEALKAKR